MTRNEDLRTFLGHTEWYTHEVGVGYVPTPNAPPYVVEAIKRWNEVQRTREQEEMLDEEQENIE